MRKLLLLIPLLVMGLYLFTGQSVENTSKKESIRFEQEQPLKWSSPLSSNIYDPSIPVPAPLPQQDNYIHPNTESKVIQTPYETIILAPSMRVLPRANSHQSEVILEPNPVNGNILFGSSNAVNFVGGLFISEGVYVTTNAGLNWFGSDTLQGAPINNHGGDPAPTIDKNGTFIISHLGYSTSGMFGNYSTNNGATWSANFTIQSGSVDKNLSGTDDIPTSPYYGRSYTVWTTWGSGYPSRISYTTNGGVSWSAPTNILTPLSGYIARAEDVEVGPGGVVYCVWANNVGNAAEDWMAFAKSTDGGVTFTGNNQMVDMNGLLCFNNCFAPYNIRMNSFPRLAVDKSGGARNGWIYVATSGKNIAPAGSDPDILLYRSTNGGTNWTTHRVNQDPINNGKLQFYNAVSVDGSGGLNIVYYSNANCATDSAECIVARSVDGGNTFTEIVASDHRFKPKPIPGLAGGYAGDYIGIASASGRVLPFWMDDVTGTFQTWTAHINLGPGIAHTPLPNTENMTGPYVVNCVITPAGSPIVNSTVKLHWRRGAAAWDSLTMTNSSGNNWTGNIPGNGTPATYNYYITAFDQLNRLGTSGTLANPHVFMAGPDNVKPIITHTPLPNQPLITWPATINATVVDPADYGGLDSVWVRWYKNTTSTGVIHLKLVAGANNTYSAAFNSTNVNIGDSIFYRIIAQDNSSAHNRDSTALNKFYIVNQVTKCIGTSATTAGYPFYTFYMDSKTDMLYLASEIQVSSGMMIEKIGFTVATAASQTMNGFQIKMQNTSLTTLSGFVTTGWTTVYNGTYTVPSVGLQYIMLQNPFPYNGTSNLLVEICFNNSSYTSNTTVNADPAHNDKYWHRHADLSSGNGCTDNMTSTATGGRPNVCFQGTPLTGIADPNIQLPKSYALNQNYPNPFNPVTKITYALPKAGDVTITVFDITGKQVARLVNGYKTPGNYTVEFNAGDLASGMYLYRIEAGDFIDTKKMVLIK